MSSALRALARTRAISTATPPPYWIGVSTSPSSTAALTAQKIDWIRAGAGDRFDDLEIEIGAYFTVVTDQRDATLAKMAPMFAMEPEQFAEHPHALIGSVDSICEQLIERRESLGISYVTFGGSVVESVAPIVERLAGT